MAHRPACRRQGRMPVPREERTGKSALRLRRRQACATKRKGADWHRPLTMFLRALVYHNVKPCQAEYALRRCFLWKTCGNAASRLAQRFGLVSGHDSLARLKRDISCPYRARVREEASTAARRFTRGMPPASRPNPPPLNDKL